MKMPAQLKLTEDFLKNGSLTVDIFALSPAQAPLKPGAATQSDLSTTFAVGEEAESKVAAAGGEAVPVTAPLNRVQPAVAPRRHCACRRSRAHEKSRSFLPRRHRRCLRHLARTEGHRRQRPDDFLERHGRRQRARSGGERRSLLPLLADRCSRQSHQQTQRLGHARGGLCASDSTGRG